MRVPVSSIIQLTIWLMSVANEAPVTPMSNIKMKTASSMMLSTAPDVIPIMA